MKKVLFVMSLMAVMFPMIAGAQTKAMYHEFVSKSECDSFTWTEGNGETYTDDTVAFYISNDTLYVLDLEIHHSTNTTAEVSAGCKYEWGDSTYMESTVATHTFKDRFDCDSTVTLTLTLADTARSYTEVTACKSYSWHGRTFTGEMDTLVVDTTSADIEAEICAALDTLKLVIKMYATGEDVELDACSEYHRASNDSTYTSDATYYDTVRYTASGVCDSVFNVSLHIITPEVGTVIDTTVRACKTPIGVRLPGANGQIVYRAYRTMDSTNVFITTADDQCLTNSHTIHFILNSPDTTEFDTTSCGPFVYDDTTYTSTRDIFKRNVGKTTQGCDSNLFIHLTVYEDLKIRIAGNLDILPGGSTTLTAVCDHDDATFDWSYSGQSSNASSVTLTGLNDNTDVTLTATSADQNCSRTTNVTVMVSPYVNGIDDVLGAEVRLYPNPASSYINIESDRNVKSVTVYNMAGQKIEDCSVASGQLRLNVSNYNNGIYMLNMNMEDGSVVNQKIAVKK